jgi:hypothetical protein
MLVLTKIFKTEYDPAESVTLMGVFTGENEADKAIVAYKEWLVSFMGQDDADMMLKCTIFRTHDFIVNEWNPKQSCPTI